VVTSCGELNTETALGLGEEKHPADEIGKALLQASGILTSLSNCYDKPESNFSIGTPFIAEAIIAVEGILSKANESLTKLYDHYDLGKLEAYNAQAHDKAAGDVRVETTSGEPDADAGYLGYFGRQNQGSRLSVKLDAIRDSMPEYGQELRPENMTEQPAQSYDELLEKLTAMTDAAAFQAQNNEQQDQNLLPMLESLRADLMRLRTVA
jgi:hypothetical protein